MGIYRYLNIQIFHPINPVFGLPTVDRPWARLTEQSTDVHRTCTSPLAIGPVDRTIDRSRDLALDLASVDRPERVLSGSGLDRPGGRPTVKIFSLCLGGRSTERLTGSPNSQKSDRWSVDRVVDRQVIFDLFWTPMAIFWIPYKFGSLRPVLDKIFKSKNSSLLKCFQLVFKRSFCAKILYLYLFSKF